LHARRAQGEPRHRAQAAAVVGDETRRDRASAAIAGVKSKFRRRRSGARRRREPGTYDHWPRIDLRAVAVGPGFLAALGPGTTSRGVPTQSFTAMARWPRASGRRAPPARSRTP